MTVIGEAEILSELTIAETASDQTLINVNIEDGRVVRCVDNAQTQAVGLRRVKRRADNEHLRRARRGDYFLYTGVRRRDDVGDDNQGVKGIGVKTPVTEVRQQIQVWAVGINHRQRLNARVNVNRAKRLFEADLIEKRFTGTIANADVLGGADGKVGSFQTGTT
ncbi:MAG: hypothetical protein LAO09_21225, partial [Acidobacteriia bacterium]|nr:hypothetical protein [Terriglobia bacterium]